MNYEIESKPWFEHSSKPICLLFLGNLESLFSNRRATLARGS